METEGSSLVTPSAAVGGIIARPGFRAGAECCLALKRSRRLLDAFLTIFCNSRAMVSAFSEETAWE